MKDETIREGDLVMVVRWPHQHDTHKIGTIFVVAEVRDTFSYCPRCSSVWSGPVATRKDETGVSISWLKKINPPAQDETTETREEATA